MLFPIKYQKGVASVAFNGFDLLPITQQPVTVNMTFYPTFVATNVALAGSDLSINATFWQCLNFDRQVAARPQLTQPFSSVAVRATECRIQLLRFCVNFIPSSAKERSFPYMVQLLQE